MIGKSLLLKLLTTINDTLLYLNHAFWDFSGQDAWLPVRTTPRLQRMGRIDFIRDVLVPGINPD